MARKVSGTGFIRVADRLPRATCALQVEEIFSASFFKIKKGKRSWIHKELRHSEYFKEGTPFIILFSKELTITQKFNSEIAKCH